MLFNKDKTTLIFCPTGKSGSCEIPNSVTNIGVSAFAYCYLLTSIVIPDSVTSIGGNAFKYCTGLTSVTIPDSVTSIGGYTFELCTGLTSVTIPDSVTSIGSSAFFYCESLTDVYYGGTEEQWNAVSIGSGNEYLTGATIHFAEEIPEEPEYVASGTCGENLTWTLDSEGTLTISGTGEMTNWAYSSDVSWHSNRELITNVVIDYGVTSIGDKAFYPCENLTSVAIPDSVTSIGIWAFYDCVALRSVTIPDGVLKISEKAFYNCSGLTTVSIPDSVNYIGKEAFYSCDGLTAVYITDLAAWCNIDFETALANPLYYANNLYVNDTAVFELKIPDGVTEIKKDTFLNEQNFTSITFPDSVTTIGYEAFYNCDSVTQITIPVSVTSIGAYAFCDCSYLTDVYYEGTQEQWNSLSIGLDNQSLTNATIHFAEVEPEFVASGACGDNLTWTLDDEGVLNINGSGDMYDFSDGTPWAMWEESIKSVNIAEGVTYIGEWAFSDCRNLVDLTIPGTVTEIGSCAFTNCTALQSVTIPYGVETIGSIAFNACTSLKELTISDSVKIIESEAFSWCVALTDVTIGGNVTSIGGAAFSDCTGLTAVSIPCSVTDIDDSAFNNCESLTDVYYSGAKSQWNKIVIGEENEPLTSATIHFAEEPDYTLGENLTWELSEDGVLTISGTGEMPDYVYAYDSPWFSRVSEIKKVIISEGVTKIGKYCFDLHANIESVSIADSVTVIGNHAFSFCSGLTEINIPDGVTVIDEYTFDNCKTLEKIEIGSGVTTIKGMAFSNCSALTTVTIPKTVTEIEDYAFFYATAITDVYYKGSSSMWETISIGDSNTSLTNATIHFAEEDEPADDGNSGVSGGGFKDPDIVTGSDGFNRYYIDGEIQTKWQVTPSGYKYYFSTSVAKYGAATIGTGIKIAGVYYDFDTDGRLIESYDEEGNPVHYCNPDEGAIYTVIYDAQGGTPSVAGKRRRISANADLSVTAEKENCKFLGWGLTKFATEPITSCTVTGDMTLYAIYEQVYVVMCEDGYYRYYVDGTACTGWQITPDGYKYYFSSGSSKYGAAMVGKNQKVGGSYYDFAEDGKLIDSYDNDGNPVYFKHLEGFVSDSQGNTKFYKDNKFVIDWQYIDGYKYYFSKSTGNMLTGYTRVGSVYYSFNQDGTWNGYFQTPKTEEECLYSDLLTKDEDGKYRYYVDGEAYKGWKVLKGDTGYYKYYFSKSDGGALTVYGVKVGSEYLDFSPTGTLITVTRDENGNAVMSDYILSFEQGAKNGVLLDDDGCYRYYIDGEYQIGWQTVDGYKYYFKTKDGAGITTKNYKLGSFWYDFTPDGKFLAKKKTPDTRFVVNLMPGEGATGNEIITGVVLNTEYTLPENTFEKENYRFAGWTDGNEIFRPGKIILVNGDKQFTAVWEYILKDFVFTFTYLEESITISTKEGESVVLPENTFAKEGYEFDGWTDGENTYLSGSSITVTGNMSFTPLWKYIPKDVTLTFKDKDAEPYVITVKEGHKMRLGDGIFEREGCRFIGWMNDIYIYFPEDEITILEDMVFTAVWQKVTEVRTPITAEFIQPANLGTSFDSEFTGDNPYLSLYDEDNDYTNTEYPLETDTVIVINGYNAGVISENESTYYGGLTNATDLGLIYAPNQGEVVLVDKDDDGKYDVIEVTAYETTVVTEVYGANKKIATWYTPSIDLTNAVDGKEGYSYELTKNGQKMEISELKENDILSVAVSPDKKNYKILVSDTKVEGVVVSAYKPSGLSVDEYIWTINDTEYRISNFADRDGSLSFTVSEIIAGDEGVAYLDTFGKIALFEKEPRVKPEECSFIVGAAPYTSSNSTHYEAEFLNADGSITVCDFADYVDVTVGETYQGRASSEDVYNTYIVPNALYAADGTLTWIFENDATYYSDADCTSVVYENGDYVTIPLMERYAGRMVSYETDENGEITKIVFSQLTSLGNIENGLFCDAVFEKLEYIEASKCFGGYAEINEGTVIFNLPITSSSKETDFEILTLSDLQDGYSYDICVLQHDDATYSAGVIVITKERIPGVDVEVSWDECFAVVTKVMTAKDADSYDVVQITFIQGGEENTLWTTPELYESAKSITKGSLFEYSLDEDGRINKIDFANLGNGAYPLPTAGYVAEFGAEPSAYTDETGYAEGFVTAKVASRRIQIKDEATLVADIRNGTNSAAYRHSLDSANVYIIDLTKTNITPEIAAFGDIQATYVDADGMISDTDRDTYVLIKYVKGVATDVVVYKGYAKVNNILQ